MDWTQIIESETLEAKRRLPTSNKLAIEVVAFANTRGGRIVIGYDEKAKAFVGVVPGEKLEEKIANIIHDCCEPQVTYTVSYESVQDKPLLIIDVTVSTSKPHYIKSKGLAQGTYVRVGSTCRLADQETLARLIREGKHISLDSETVSRSVSLDREKIQRFLAERKKRLGARASTASWTGPNEPGQNPQPLPMPTISSCWPSIRKTAWLSRQLNTSLL